MKILQLQTDQRLDKFTHKYMQGYSDFNSYMYFKSKYLLFVQSELPPSVSLNSIESDLRCTSRIYFDNAGDNATLTLYNLTLKYINFIYSAD